MRIAIAMYNNLLDLSLEGVPAYKLPRQGYSRTTIIFKSAHPGLVPPLLVTCLAFGWWQYFF